MTEAAIIHVGVYDAEACDGVVQTMVGQVNALHDQGVNVEVWNWSSDIKEPTQSQTPTGVICWTLPAPKRQWGALFALPKATHRWILSRKKEVALLHLHSVFTLRNNLLAGYKIPYVITPNGGWEPRVFRGKNRLLKALWVCWKEKRLWSRACFVQSVSPSEQQNLVALPGIAPVELIPNGTELPDLSSPEPKDLWLFLGRLAVDQKGLDLMIQAYARCGDLGVDLPPLVLAGPDFREGRAFLESLIQSLHLEEKITFAGSVRGMAKARLFQRARLFLHTSRWEGLPLAILEALAHGVPCLLTPGTNIAREVSDSGAGLLSGSSVEEIAQAMILAAKSCDQRMEEKAREFAEVNYSWPSVGEKLWAAYNRALKTIQSPHLNLYEN